MNIHAHDTPLTGNTYWSQERMEETVQVNFFLTVIYGSFEGLNFVLVLVIYC